ncbi:MAG: carbohydrate-binding family 9-like protein [Aridibacter sp.]
MDELERELPKNIRKAAIQYISEDFPISELNNKSWNSAETITTKNYSSGEKAPDDRHFRTKLLWSDAALYVRFEANRKEPLVINDKPDLQNKTDKLWEKDVCEIFLAPNIDEFRKYFEFEIAPTGEWIDIGIHQMPDRRETDWDYNSGMKTAAKIENNKVLMAFKIEWKAFGKTPQVGDVWLGNIFRAMGSEPNRGYLAWSPTLTEQPNFHVPEKFGVFEFIK